jgi:hypothetical protein
MAPQPGAPRSVARGAALRHDHAGEQCAELGVLIQVDTLPN